MKHEYTSGRDAHFSKPLKALTFSSSGIFLKSDPNLEHSFVERRLITLTFGFVRQSLSPDHTLLLILNNFNTLNVKVLLQLGKVDIWYKYEHTEFIGCADPHTLPCC